MGKRKSARKPGAGKVKAKPLDKVFKCLFCQHVGSVACKMDRQNRIGRLDCKDCLQSFQAAITPLDEPVDLYSEWIDACEAVNTAEEPPRPQQRVQRPAQDAEGDSDDEELPEASFGRSKTDDVDDDDDEDDEGPVNGESQERSATNAKMQDLINARKARVVDEDEDED